MSDDTKIEWADATWNPITGCTRISKGCTNCYMFKNARWLQGMGQAKYANGATLTLHPDCLDDPKGW